MTAPAIALNRFDRLARELPPVLDGRVLLTDGTYPGVSVNPLREAILPGDYLFEQDVWLRVIETRPVERGTEVRCGRGHGAALTVPSGNSVNVWRLADVVEHANAGGAL